MDISRVVWYLLYPTNIENMAYAFSGGYKRKLLGNPGVSLFKWADIRVVYNQGSPGFQLQLRASNNECIPVLIQQIQEMKGR